MNTFTKIIIDFRFSQLTEENASGNIFVYFIYINSTVSYVLTKNSQ